MLIYAAFEYKSVRFYCYCYYVFFVWIFFVASLPLSRCAARSYFLVLLVDVKSMEINKLMRMLLIFFFSSFLHCTFVAVAVVVGRRPATEMSDGGRRHLFVLVQITCKQRTKYMPRNFQPSVDVRLHILQRHIYVIAKVLASEN